MLPLNPVDGERFDNLEWSDTIGGWIKSKNLIVNTFSTNQVCFHGQNVGVGHVIYFNEYYKPTVVKINEGNCFNTNTGLFTAPHDGLYFISWGGLMLMIAGTTTHSYLKFCVNDIEVSGACHSAYGLQRDYDSLASTYLAQLSTGDTIGCKIFNEGPAKSNAAYLQSQTYANRYTGMDITFIR